LYRKYPMPNTGTFRPNIRKRNQISPDTTASG
jgi:hypothetical protein